jgi:hypothetical protein
MWRLLKSKYYPNGRLLDTVFARDASASWRGVEHGLELMKKGVIWRIGNGGKVNIWRDNWLSRDGALKVTGGNTHLRLRKVKALFGNGPNGWNEQII